MKGSFEADFEHDRQYVGVHLLFVDAKGHSTFVASNDEENVLRVFDRFEEEVERACDDASKRERCRRMQPWGWMGDGGLVVFHDDYEGTARRAALRAAVEVLKAKDVINEWIERDDRVNGGIHIRIAIHKGALRYRERTGSIHSSALNLAAHAEKNAPADSIVVSEDIYRVCSSDEKDQYSALSPALEGTAFYVQWEDNRSEKDLNDEWQANVLVPVVESQYRSDIATSRLRLDAIFSQRAATAEYAGRIESCTKEIAVLGTGLSGFVADHADLLRRKAAEGLHMRILLPSDTVRVACGDGEFKTVPAWRASPGGEAGANAEWANSLAVFRELAASAEGVVQLRAYTALPSGALLAIDESVYFSPFLTGREGLKTFTLAVHKEGVLGHQLMQHFDAVWLRSEPVA
jgi:class 3 adenylate cyclase